MTPLVQARGWGWRHAGRARWAVSDLDLTIEDGERVLLLGPSGAGKSTLLHALAGVLGGADEGEATGDLFVAGEAPARRRGVAGLMMQDPDGQIVLARVGDDVAFGPENLGVAPDKIWGRVRAALDDVGLDVGLDHPTHALSGGQKQRLVLAGLLAMEPRLLLLDEPTANLDPAGVAEVRDAVARSLDRRGGTFVVVEHRVDVWLPLITRVVIIDPAGGLLADGPPEAVFAAHGESLAAAGVWVPGLPPAVPALVPDGSAEPALAAQELTIGYDRPYPVRIGLATQVPLGRSTVLTGDNGSGKTTLALTLAGLLPRLGGRVSAHPSLRPARRRGEPEPDPARWRSRELLTRIGTVFQEPEHQFVAATVRDELAVGLHALGIGEAEITARADALLEQLRLASLARANPFTLSGGEKRRLSVATVLATQPAVLVLDEPTFGQDRVTWAEVVRLVQQLRGEGRTVLSVTHDPDYVTALGEHRVHLVREPAGGRP